MTMRCQACRRPLTNPASVKHGLGPDCLRKAVNSGMAPIDALDDLNKAVTACQSVGITVTLNIEEL